MKTTIKNKVAKNTLFKDLVFGDWFYAPGHPSIICCAISDEMHNSRSAYNVFCISGSGIFFENAEPDEEVVKISSIEIIAK